MKTRFIVTTAAFAVTLGLSGWLASAMQAETRDPGVNARQAVQHVRIQQGRASGELTPGETRRLRAQQGHIRRTERRMKADGELTAGERARLHGKQNRAGRNIHRKKHNDRQVDK